MTELDSRLRWRLDDPHYAGKSLDTVIEELSIDGTIVGTPDMIVEQINAYSKVGADELVLQWFDLDDIVDFVLSVSTVSKYVEHTWTPRSRRPKSVRHAQRSCHIPRWYRLRYIPKEHVGWDVPRWDQR